MKIAELDQDKLRLLSDALASSILKAHDSWNNPTKLQEARERCEAENKARKERLKR